MLHCSIETVCKLLRCFVVFHRYVSRNVSSTATNLYASDDSQSPVRYVEIHADIDPVLCIREYLHASTMYELL